MQRLLDCACGFHFYINPAPCAIAVLSNAKGEVLFVVRANFPRKGYLDLPGGFIKCNERGEEGIQRELREELGVVPGRLRYMGSYPDRYWYRGIRYHVMSLVYVGKFSAKEESSVCAADDVSGIEWHLMKKLPFNRFAFPSMKKIVNDFLATR